MKYLLRPLDPDYPDIWFDTNNINDLARLGGWDEDVVYVAGTAYHAPLDEKRPSTRITSEYVRELEGELLAMKAEMTTLALKADELVMELTGVDSPEDDALVDTALPVSVNLVVYELMELAHSALAANEAQS